MSKNSQVFWRLAAMTRGYALATIVLKKMRSAGYSAR